MHKISQGVIIKQPDGSKKKRASRNDDDLLHLAFENSIQANIISTVNSGKIVIANEAACKLLGYSKNELLTKSRAAIFDINESSFKKMLKQRTAYGHSIALVTIIKKDGRALPCEITSAVFKDKNDLEKSITTIADLSQSILKQKNIDAKKEEIVVDNIILAQAKSDSRQADNNQWKKRIAETSYDVMWDWDITTGKIYVGDSIEEVFGYKVKNNTVSFTDFSQSLLPEEKDAIEKKLFKTLASCNKSWNDSYMLKRYDGSVASTTCRASIVRDKKGKAIRLVGAIQDISRLKELEGKLEDEIRLKQKQIIEASEDAREMERSDIGKELHDNVNQLLGASKLYLDMAKRGGENSKIYLSRSSECTLTAVEEIRKLTKRLTTTIITDFGLREAIDTLARDTMEVNLVKISCALDSFNEEGVNDKFKLSVYRIVQEHLNNILKHAKATEVFLRLSQNTKCILLTILDNGIGFDTSKIHKGIGVANIKSRAVHYKGTADFVSQPDEGCVLTVTFPFSDELLNQG